MTLFYTVVRADRGPPNMCVEFFKPTVYKAWPLQFKECVDIFLWDLSFEE